MVRLWLLSGREKHLAITAEDVLPVIQNFYRKAEKYLVAFGILECFLSSYSKLFCDYYGGDSVGYGALSGIERLTLD